MTKAKPKPALPNDGLNVESRSHLSRLRIFWTAVLFGSLMELFAAMSFAARGTGNLPPEQVQIWLMVALGSLVVLSPVGLILRLQAYKQGWKGMVVEPAAYSRGNIRLFGCLFAICSIAALTIIITRVVVPTALILIVALGLHALNFPTGKPLRPVPPALARK